MYRVMVLAALCAAAVLGGPPIRGFPQSQWKAQHALEERLRALPESTRVREYIERISAEPHHAGSPESKKVAEYAAGLLRGWGYSVEVERYEALLPTPTQRLVEMIRPKRIRALLAEPVLREDPDSGDANQLPVYNAYGASGDVTGEVVYVNYGLPEDYEKLKKRDIEVRGKIVLVRYGKSWRGIKAKVAAQMGAAGCLIYSDPRDDGYFMDDVFPEGPMRPSFSAQRGSVMDMPVYPGDPLSPGWASEARSRRLKREEAKTLMKIPVLPLTYAEAQPILENLRGPVAPQSWRGALPLTYHLGPGPATIHMVTDYDWATKPLYNVIARMPGEEESDQWVLFGNHHDAWVNGAGDPASGAAATLETARALAELRRQGWKPRRTVIVALWDAEEFGLVGSTEWVEKHKRALQQRAVAYLNTDMNTAGALGASGSGSLEVYFEQAMRDVIDPETGKPVLHSSDARLKKKDKPVDPPRLNLEALGAGSDYVAFVHHAGIASLNFGFHKEGPFGVYHSIYDSFAWYDKFGDPGYRYGRKLAELEATAIVRMASAPLVPFEFLRLVDSLDESYEAVKKAAESAKAPEGTVAPVGRSLEGLRRAAVLFEAAYGQAEQKAQRDSGKLKQINERIYRTERLLAPEEGLSQRPWYKHKVFAPGLYTGYGAKTLPGVLEALEEKEFSIAQSEAVRAAAAFEKLSQELESIAGDLRSLN